MRIGRRENLGELSPVYAEIGGLAFELFADGELVVWSGRTGSMALSAEDVIALMLFFQHPAVRPLLDTAYTAQRQQWIAQVQQDSEASQ